MRSLIVVLMLGLVGCNSDDDSSLVTKAQAPNESTQIAALQAEVSSLQTSIKQIQLIGRPVGTTVAHSDSVRDFRMLGEPTLAPSAVTVTGQFGPCVNMGILIGFINNNGQPADALSAFGQAFRQCTGYQYETNLSTGAIISGERIFWDGPNCTGNLLEWESGGAGPNTASLQNGVVFTNPFDNTTVEMVKAGQIPQPILIQSVWVKENPICQADIETQLMYQVTPNDVSISGVPSNGVGKFQLGSP